jgi:hypothetical protein
MMGIVMKKLILCGGVCLLTMYSSSLVTANEPGTRAEHAPARVEEHIAEMFRQIEFGVDTGLSFSVFQKAYRGYLNLANAGKLNADRQVLSICDFSLSSKDARLWIIDLKQKKLLYRTHVAHGQGSGEEYATRFSNRNNSHQSSLGFYVTGETYEGKHGRSLRLHGMDQGFNHAALERGIVVHGADYVCDRFVETHSRLGRSWGCPAVASELSAGIIETIRDGTCLFIYYPDQRYLASAYWLNRPVERVPATDPFPLLPGAAGPEQEQLAAQVIDRDSFMKQERYMPVVERLY